MYEAPPARTPAGLLVSGSVANYVVRLEHGDLPALIVDGTKVFVACNKLDEILEVDVAKWAITRRLKSGSGPCNLGIAVSPDSRYAFVSSEGLGKVPGKVDVYDLRALTKVGTVDVGPQARGIAFWKTEPAK